MASKAPPVKNAAFTFRILLFAQADDQIKTTPTIAAGDFKVSIDGGALANPGTTPSESPASSGQVLVTLTAAEMNGDEIVVRWIDASGAEWHSGGVVLHTVAQTFDTMDTNIDSVKTDTAAILLDTGTDGVVLANDAITAAKIAADAIGASELAADAVAEIADAVWDEASAGHVAAGSLGKAVADILVDTAEIGTAGAGLTEAGGTGDHLTAIVWNADWDAQVQSEVQDALDATLADSVPADGTRPSIAQAIYMITQFLLERSVSGTTVTVKKVDGSTSLMTLTLNDGTTPTSITRAT
jgi:hypothetical protein